MTVVRVKNCMPCCHSTCLEGLRNMSECTQTRPSVASRLQGNATAFSIMCHFQISVFPLPFLPLQHMHTFFCVPAYSWNCINSSVIGPQAFSQIGPVSKLIDFMSELWWSGFMQFSRSFHNWLFIISWHRSLNIIVSFTASLKVPVGGKNTQRTHLHRTQGSEVNLNSHLPQASWGHLPSMDQPFFRLPVSLCRQGSAFRYTASRHDMRSTLSKHSEYDMRY